jgi:hypothetical protein
MSCTAALGLSATVKMFLLEHENPSAVHGEVCLKPAVRHCSKRGAECPEPWVHGLRACGHAGGGRGEGYGERGVGGAGFEAKSNS